MARTLLVAGTASHVGKSTVVAGLCRWLARQEVAVAPYKAQNMSNNARVALTRDGEWGEIGISQYVQARAAGLAPTTDMNPVLLKPRGGGESQVVIDGQAVGNYPAREYYEATWEEARAAARRAHHRLADSYDVIVAEGAGSPAEINLQDRDLANVETARFADADLLLVTDIERGGAFASLFGTVELLPDDLRDRLIGMVINKFRGDRSILADGIDAIENRTAVPVLGVLPHDDPGLPEEDSVSLPDEAGAVLGADDGVADEAAVTVVVPRLARLSNAPDIEPLVRAPGVRVRICPPDDDLRDADAVVIPGSKNTVDDLLELREAGFEAALADFDGPVVGLCGGYQMLGERLTNAAIEGTGDDRVVEGFGRLPVETRFSTEKQVELVTRAIQGVGPLAGAQGTVSGYEIHMGQTVPTDAVETPIGSQSAATETVLGTYLHGLFENENARAAFLETVFEQAEVDRPAVTQPEVDPYERAGDLVGQHLDLDRVDLPS